MRSQLVGGLFSIFERNQVQKMSTGAKVNVELSGHFPLEKGPLGD
jgi:hypothetical protein